MVIRFRATFLGDWYHWVGVQGQAYEDEQPYLPTLPTTGGTILDSTVYSEKTQGLHKNRSLTMPL